MAPLQDLLSQTPAFFLVFTRVTAVMVLLPGLGEMAAPSTVRAGLAVMVTVVLVPALPDRALAHDAAGWLYLVQVAGEAVTGLWFGWMTRLAMLALPIAGQMIAYCLGLSSVLQPDPQLGAQSSAISTMLNLAAPPLVLATGLYRLPLEALHGLFELIPLGQMLPGGDTADSVVGAVSRLMALSLQLSAPFIIASVVWNAIMGLLARAAARMQIYFMSVPGQLIAGLALLVLCVGGMLAAWEQATAEWWHAMPGI